MRVLHMVGSLAMGGAQTMVMALYRAIDRSKVQFDFVLDCEDDHVFVNEIESLGGRVFNLPKFNGKNFLQVRAAWNNFFFNHPEYKVLHSHIRSYASLYLPIAKAHGVKTIIHSHNTSNGKGIASIGKKILQYPLRFQADYFFGCSEIAGKWLFGDKVVKSDRYFMLKNAVDLDRFAYQRQMRIQIRQELSIGEDALVIGHIGRMHPQKNHRFLVECFRDIAKIRNDVRLLLLGDGELREDLSAYIRELGLEEKIRMLGVQKKPEAYLSAMDCLMLPSLHEGLPVVVVEAQASGLPCFVADTITREVQLSQLVQYLPISQETEPWVEAVRNSNLARMDVTEQIRQGGFCVKTSSQWLCDFYLSLAE